MCVQSHRLIAGTGGEGCAGSGRRGVPPCLRDARRGGWGGYRLRATGRSCGRPGDAGPGRARTGALRAPWAGGRWEQDAYQLGAGWYLLRGPLSPYLFGRPGFFQTEGWEPMLGGGVGLELAGRSGLVRSVEAEGNARFRPLGYRPTPRDTTLLWRAAVGVGYRFRIARAGPVSSR